MKPERGSYPKWAFLLLPYTRNELPGWGWLTRKAGVMVPIDDRRWDFAPFKSVRGKLHGYEMKLDLRDWSERLTYFLGRYYELGVQKVVIALLQPGDRFVDIGANIGMISLLAARLVSKEGHVDSFEPNPETLRLLREAIERNAIDHIEVYPVGLADQAGHLTLRLSSEHSGTATLAAVSEESTVKTFEVEVNVADEVLLEDSRSIRMIKIDVEGFEVSVLNGLTRTIERDRPFIITEFVAEQFEDAEASYAAMQALLAPLGFRAYGIGTRRRFLRHVLRLVEVSPDRAPVDFAELLWARPECLDAAGVVTEDL